MPKRAARKTKLSKRQLINLIVRRVSSESPFVEKSSYTIATLRTVLKEEL